MAAPEGTGSIDRSHHLASGVESGVGLYHVVEQRDRSDANGHHARLGGAFRAMRSTSIWLAASWISRRWARCRIIGRAWRRWRLLESVAPPSPRPTNGQRPGWPQGARTAGPLGSRRRRPAGGVVVRGAEDALWRRTFMDEMDEPLFLKFLRVGRRNVRRASIPSSPSHVEVVGRHCHGQQGRERDDIYRPRRMLKKNFSDWGGEGSLIGDAHAARSRTL